MIVINVNIMVIYADYLQVKFSEIHMLRLHFERDTVPGVYINKIFGASHINTEPV